MSGLRDESQDLDLDDYLMPVPVQRLDSAESYLAVLDGFPQAFAPGSGFAYCNGGFVVLALLAERASGVRFHDLVREQVIERAGLTRTGYLLGARQHHRGGVAGPRAPRRAAARLP